MDESIKKRIERAWERCKGWITAFDGTPMVALLVDVPVSSVVPGLQALAQQVENFRMTSIPAGHADRAEFIPLEALPGHWLMLQEKKLAELSANYGVRREAFELDIHLILYALDPQKAALELDWWNDQVFSEETDNPDQFFALMEYFIGLQSLFGAPGLHLSPEAGKDPAGGMEAWVEV